MKITHFHIFRRRCFSSLLVYLFLLSLLIPVMAKSLGLLPTGYINLEYLLLGALGVFLRQNVVFALLLLESVVDFARTIGYTYMLSVTDLLYSLRSLNSLPIHRILEMSAVLVLIVAVCAMAAHARPRSEDRVWVASSLLFFIAFLTSAAFFAGQDPFKPGDLIYGHGRLVRAGTYSLVRLELFLHRVDLEAQDADDVGTSSASSRAITFLDSPEAAKSPNVVLIIFESWGYTLDARLTEEIDAAYDDPRVAEKYDISHGSVAFQGGTISAEARELCQSKMGFHIIVAPPQSLSGCLPALFHARNYQNLSIHGFVGSMFQRETWYPKIGFDRSWFNSDLKKIKLRDCDGVFPGTCDADVAGWIGSSLLSEDNGKPKFIYWVTLNSHLPVPARLNLADDNVCFTLSSLRDSVPLCSWFRLVRNVHQSVQQLALKTSPRNTVFVVVGDHAPPFADPKIRQVFSPAVVPFVMLTPRLAVSQ